MVAVSDQPSSTAWRLAQRLRDLHASERLTQKQLARVLGGSDALSVVTVSSREKHGSDRLPQLAAYARFLCTSRSFEGNGPRLLNPGELTDAAEPPSCAKPSDVSYSRYTRHADLDALFEVFGQGKASDPACVIRILLPARLTQRPARATWSSAAMRQVCWHRTFRCLPSRRFSGTDPVTYLFYIQLWRGDMRVQVVAGRQRDLGAGRRADPPWPVRCYPWGMATLLGGIIGAGIYGAALSFAGSHVRDIDKQDPERAFWNAEPFCILMNIPAQNTIVLPPNLWRANTRLFEWSAQTGARGG